MSERSLLERVPPQNVEAEACLLGSLLLDRDVVGTILPLVEGQFFYRPDHQKIYEVIVDLYDRNQPLDIVVLKEELRKRGLLDKGVDVDYLASLVETVPSPANAEHYAQIVKEKAVARSLIQACNQILQDAYGDATGADELLDRAEGAVFRVSQHRAKGESIAIGDLMQDAFKMIDNIQGERLTGLDTGFIELNDMTSGLQPSELIILAGRPSMGKSTFGLNFLMNVGVKNEIPCAFFSMEMAKMQVVQNMLCSRAQVPGHKLRRGMVSQDDTRKLVNAADALSEAPILIDDTPGMKILEVRAKARRLKAQHDIQFLVLDYIQLMSGQGRRADDNRQQEIADISRGLKGLARELNIPIVAISQLSRATEAREGHVPRMSDLRESGALEQDADMVLLLYREDYYHPEQREGEVDLIIAKQRNGPTGKILLSYAKEFYRFGSFARE
jgi:replicative DNA helicase